MSVLITGQPVTYQAPEKAERVAEGLNHDEANDGWRYVVEHGTQWSRIAVYDEDNRHLGYL